MTLFFLYAFLIILGYLMGSISAAIIVCRVFNLPDPRAEGSRNPGATNVLRLAGKQYAVLVLVGDLLKGTIPVLIAKFLGADAVTVAFTALAAVIGHMYPVFFEFQGGKGVATALGALLGFQFIVGVMAAATWLLVVNFTRYSSLASIITIILSPFYALIITHHMDTFLPLSIIVILVLFKHRNNITRLIDGVEPKVKLKHDHVIKEIKDPLSEHLSTVELPETTAEAEPTSVIPLTKPVPKKPVKKASSSKKVSETKSTTATDKPVKKTAAKLKTAAKAKSPSKPKMPKD